MLVAAMNPCPCGYYPDKNKCMCLPYQIQKYLAHISGPILDRIDVVSQTTSMKEAYEEYQNKTPILTSEQMRKQVIGARTVQKERYLEYFGSDDSKWNAYLGEKEMEKLCVLDKEATSLAGKLVDKFSLSGRAFHSIMKVSRTIADLENSEKISEKHLAEAASYRLGFERYFHG